MKDRERIQSIYEIYKGLLTEREQDYFENYYYEDYNLQEIADNYEVSKAYVGKYINDITEKIENYEKVLKVAEKTKRIRELIADQDDEILKLKIEEIL